MNPRERRSPFGPIRTGLTTHAHARPRVSLRLARFTRGTAITVALAVLGGWQALVVTSDIDGHWLLGMVVLALAFVLHLRLAHVYRMGVRS